MKEAFKLLKFFAVVLILSGALYGGYHLLRTSDVSFPSLLQPTGGARLFMSTEGFRFTQSENGQVAWRMYARKADLFENKEAKLKNFEITFQSPEQKQAALFGDTGIMDTVTGNASIRGVSNDVRIVTSDGYVLTTNSLYWKAGQKLVSTQDPFKLLGSEIYLEGKGLSANVDMRTIAVNSNVKAVLQE